ncbi:uncharacterized protein LODBEIA_P33330 [Lodderomyces beijingensis]|uniref:Uncharacterized protein n=1 Tax=Lodderomyces beijingensis TaxID=1775926 RepID=A0ABP0ZMI0_9ASCO
MASSTDETQAKQHPLHNAIKEGNTKLAEHLIQTDPALLYSKDEDERTPLHWACSRDNTHLVRYILDHTPSKLDLDEFTDSSGWTPLHIAASIGNVEILNLLMHHEVEVDVDAVTNTGTTPLQLSISKQHLPFVRALLGEFGANARKKDKLGMSALHRAAAGGNLALVQEVVEHGKNVNVNAKDNQGWSALHHALAEGNGDVAVWLVREGGADVNLVDDDGLKPAQVSVDEKVGRYFLEQIGQPLAQ